jgi:hypothetical protein
MNTESEKHTDGAGRARWIAAGFVGAFAASVLTVIYTGLMVEGSRSDFDAGFRSVTMTIGESRVLELFFDSPLPLANARLEVSLPDMLGFAEGAGGTSQSESVDLVVGRNVLSVEVRAHAAGSAYLVARVFGEEPVALERVFVTVTAE